MSPNEIHIRHLNSLLSEEQGFLSSKEINKNLCILVTDKQYILPISTKIPKNIDKTKVLWLVVGGKVIEEGEDASQQIKKIVEILK